MFENCSGYIINILTASGFAVCWGIIIFRFITGRFGKEKTTRATVVDKYKTKCASKVPGVFQREQCVIVFSTGEKKLTFNVSEFSFEGYTVNEKGMLKYRGNRLIDFR